MKNNCLNNMRFIRSKVLVSVIFLINFIYIPLLFKPFYIVAPGNYFNAFPISNGLIGPIDDIWINVKCLESNN